MSRYLAIALIAFSSLALEVTLVRLLSVITWYHLAFFAISTAMLGMTAGAVTVYLRQRWFADSKLDSGVAIACIAYSVLTPFCLVILTRLPLGFEAAGVTITSVGAFALATMLCSIPFFCSGVAIAALLTMTQGPIGRMYGADLIGASAGCLLVLGGLALIDASSLIIYCASIGGLAAYMLRERLPASIRITSIAAFVTLAMLASINTFSSNGVRPHVVKETVVDPESILIERWNSHSRVVVDRPFNGPPQYWGASPGAPSDPIPQFWMRIDGSAGTTVRGFETRADIEHLRYDITNLAYYLRPTGGAAIIGVGGGRDLQSALLFGHDRVIGIDVNSIFIDLLNNEFGEFAGLADNPNVRLVADEARSYLSRSDESFSIIQMSLVDTWAATGAGAFSFSENALYTVEGWLTFLGRLKDDGLFTVSRWHDPSNLGETGRSLSLAVASLLALGVDNPRAHIAMLTNGNLSTLIVGRSPLSDGDVATLRRLTRELEFDIALLPDELPADPTLRTIVTADSADQLWTLSKDTTFNLSPPTDDSPYFFNMLKLGGLGAALDAGTGVLSGNLTATITLLVLLAALAVLCVVTIVLPLALGRRESVPRSRGNVLWPAMAYFALIGTGFMFTEIGLIQRLSVFLGHPVYALGVLLFTIILTTGLGSSLSDSLHSEDAPSWRLTAAAAIAITAAQFVLLWLVDAMAASSMAARIAVCVLAITPLGLVLGFFFPLGMRLARARGMTETAWLWAINGIFGVLASALAVFVAIYFSISANFWIGAACYLSLSAPLMLLSPQPRAELSSELVPT